MGQAAHFLNEQRILIATRNEQVGLEVLSEFRMAGCRTVKFACNYGDAAALLELDSFTFMIVSDDFPDMGGLEFVRMTRQLKTANCVARILLAINQPSRQEILIARNIGADKVIVNPFTLLDIKKSVNAMLHVRRPYVRLENYLGPDRRIRSEPVPGAQDRRQHQRSLIPVKKLAQIRYAHEGGF